MCHVLIIEDEPLIALNLQMLLEDSGATSVDIAETQDGAVSAARAHRPDFITSDITLKRGTGPLAVQTIHETLGAVPVIFITATPEACFPRDPNVRVFGKPMNEPAIARAFQELTPRCGGC